jgi:hypothetical protein
MSDKPGRTVPWDELEPSQKDQFTELLHAMGIDVEVDEAQRYYGNKELVKENSPYK